MSGSSETAPAAIRLLRRVRAVLRQWLSGALTNRQVIRIAMRVTRFERWGVRPITQARFRALKSGGGTGGGTDRYSAWRDDGLPVPGIGHVGAGGSTGDPIGSDRASAVPGIIAPGGACRSVGGRRGGQQDGGAQQRSGREIWNMRHARSSISAVSRPPTSKPLNWPRKPVRRSLGCRLEIAISRP